MVTGIGLTYNYVWRNTSHLAPVFFTIFLGVRNDQCRFGRRIDLKATVICQLACFSYWETNVEYLVQIDLDSRILVHLL